MCRTVSDGWREIWAFVDPGSKKRPTQLKRISKLRPVPTSNPGGPASAAPGDRVTIADIAQELGLSKAAVSYALTGRPGVGAETRRQVLAAGEEMGWSRSSSARALGGARAGVIGLVLARPPELL